MGKPCLKTKQTKPHCGRSHRRPSERVMAPQPFRKRDGYFPWVLWGYTVEEGWTERKSWKTRRRTVISWANRGQQSGTHGSAGTCMGLHEPWPANSQAWRKGKGWGPCPWLLNSLLLGDSGRRELVHSFVTHWWPHQTPMASSNPMVTPVATVKPNESHSQKSGKDTGNVWERAWRDGRDQGGCVRVVRILYIQIGNCQTKH